LFKAGLPIFFLTTEGNCLLNSVIKRRGEEAGPSVTFLSLFTLPAFTPLPKAIAVAAFETFAFFFVDFLPLFELGNHKSFFKVTFKLLLF
jgi:hypothetical protein